MKLSESRGAFFLFFFLLHYAGCSDKEVGCKKNLLIERICVRSDSEREEEVRGLSGNT